MEAFFVESNLVNTAQGKDTRNIKEPGQPFDGSLHGQCRGCATRSTRQAKVQGPSLMRRENTKGANIDSNREYCL